MGTENVSKKDPRIIYERTRNLKTGKYYTKTRTNPEYRGLSLEQAKSREKIKELNKIAYGNNNSLNYLNSDKAANIFATIVVLFLVLIIIIVILFVVKGCSSLIEPIDESSIEVELRKKESECRAKGMYPYRMDCDDITNPTCHVVCWVSPQVKISN